MFTRYTNTITWLIAKRLTSIVRILGGQLMFPRMEHAYSPSTFSPFTLIDGQVVPFLLIKSAFKKLLILSIHP